MQEQQFMSLFDFLGKAAGPDLGKEVFNQAKALNIPTKVKTVSNPKYSGTIIMYPKDFLSLYFKK